MFNLDQAITDWRRQMTAGGINTPEVLDELESHLRDDVQQQLRSGLSERQAFEAAVQRMGEASALRIEFRKVRRTKRALVQRLKNALCGFPGWQQAVPVPRLDQFTAGARQALDLAREEAPRFHHDFIGTEHVLLGLLGSGTGAVPNVLQRMGVNREAVRTEIEKWVGLGPAHEATAGIPYTPRARKALWLASREAGALNHRSVSAEHILLGLLLEGGGVAALVLKTLGVRVENAREEILKELRSNPNQA